ncbi:MAG: YqaE/Pmp3 family membrane protein [Gammaproteobacteria bacterium]
MPPVGVFMKAGATKHLFINIVLCLLFFVRGIIHGVWVVTR